MASVTVIIAAFSAGSAFVSAIMAYWALSENRKNNDKNDEFKEEIKGIAESKYDEFSKKYDDEIKALKKHNTILEDIADSIRTLLQFYKMPEELRKEAFTLIEDSTETLKKHYPDYKTNPRGIFEYEDIMREQIGQNLNLDHGVASGQTLLELKKRIERDTGYDLITAVIKAATGALFYGATSFGILPHFLGPIVSLTQEAIKKASEKDSILDDKREIEIKKTNLSEPIDWKEKHDERFSDSRPPHPSVDYPHADDLAEKTEEDVDEDPEE